MVTVPPDYLCEQTPPDAYDEGNRDASYWIRDGREVLFKNLLLRHADPATFRFFEGSFAKDARACYVVKSRLRGADPATFRALNLCYAADVERVWTIGGEVKDAHRPSFEVCDAGVVMGFIPTGYARDQDRVYYYNVDGKPNVVKKADAASFTSRSPPMTTTGSFRTRWSPRRSSTRTSPTSRSIDASSRTPGGADVTSRHLWCGRRSCRGSAPR